MEEGVIKFRQVFTKKPLPKCNLKDLDKWRQVLFKHKLIGQYPDGIGYGNVSKLLTEGPEHRKHFIITGTQTGGLEKLEQKHYTVVKEYHPEKNTVITEGPIEASSESMTHGTVYDLDKDARFVFHVHSKDLWKQAKKLGLPTTAKTVAYGTPQMTEEVKRLFRETDVRKKGIFAMAGHEEGVVSFGHTANRAGVVLLRYLKKSKLRI